MQIEEIISLAEQRKVVRGRDLEEIGASRTMLPYLAKKGVLRQVARGAYVLADYVASYQAFLEAAIAVPHGVICLLSALQFHEITTQMPPETWVAIERGRHEPTGNQLALRIVKFSGRSFHEGIEQHEIDGVVIRVYSAAKTVVDCFKFRNRIGLDVAKEALLDALEQRKATRDDMWQYAACCRMSRVIRPYLEMAR